jgi:transcriptional regulator with XRE-family HTH domain
MMEVSVMIRKNREENNFTQQELADKLGVTRQAVSGWERGKSYPDLDKLKEISILFNVSMDALLYDDLGSKQRRVRSYRFTIILIAFVAVTSLSIALYSIISPPYYQMISTFRGECNNYVDYTITQDQNSSGLMYIIYHDENVEFPHGTY